MRYLSVCSGIEAASVAWAPLGWEPWAFAEVDAFPSAVLAHHYPNVPNLGDLTKWKDWPDATLDLLVGGTPCQSFSVAGLRAGLADPRGGLLWSYLAVARRYRPRWVVWENVPGVLSIDGGRAFGALLGGLEELGYQWAYRSFDAEFFGLAQRRRRVFVVGHPRGIRAGAVLFDRSGLSGHPAPRRREGQDDCAGTLRSSDGGSDCDHAAANHLVASKGVNSTLDEGQTLVAHALRASYDASEDGTGRGTPLVLAYAPDVSEPICANEAYTYCHAGNNPVPRNVVAFQECQSGVREYDTAGALRASGPGHDPVGTRVRDGLRVRRLTPRECERLQGFPDDYTLIPYRGKPAADGPRYKALGNSMACNVMAWIGQRIQIVEGL